MRDGTITKRKRQEVDAIYDFMKQYYKENLIVPTQREIQEHFELSSLSQVWASLNHLERMGKIERTGKSYKILSAKITFDD